MSVLIDDDDGKMSIFTTSIKVWCKMIKTSILEVIVFERIQFE